MDNMFFYYSCFKGFIPNTYAVNHSIIKYIIDPLDPAPEYPVIFCSALFDGWFGIPFKDTHCLKHIHSPHTSKILTLYALSALIPVYPYIIPVTQICI